MKLPLAYLYYFIYIAMNTCETGANLDAKDRDGRRPAHYAAMRNHVNVLHLLLDLEVDLDNPCLSGKTPLHYASQHGGMTISMSHHTFFKVII